MRLHFHDGPALETTGLDEALRGEQHEVPTGVVLLGMYSFATLQVYAAATTLLGVCRITPGCSSEDPLVAAGAQRLPVLVADGSLACLTTCSSTRARHRPKAAGSSSPTPTARPGPHWPTGWPTVYGTGTSTYATPATRR